MDSVPFPTPWPVRPRAQLHGRRQYCEQPSQTHGDLVPQQSLLATHIVGARSELPPVHEGRHGRGDTSLKVDSVSQGFSSLTVSFQRDAEDVPPAFYGGQEVPVVVTLDLAEDVPLHLCPELDLQLVSTLSIGNIERPLATACSSLTPALEALASEGQCVPKRRHFVDLTARLPWDGLPPTFEVRGAKFSVSYAMRAQLNLPGELGETEEKRGGAEGRRHTVAQAETSFELMTAAGVPEPVSRIMPFSVWIPLNARRRRSRSVQTERWVIRPDLPSTTYGPTESIPLVLNVHSPERATLDHREHVVLARASLVRLERVHTSPSASSSHTSTRVTVRTAHAITACQGFAQVDLRLAVADGPTWEHGFTTHIEDGSVHASSIFQLRIDTMIIPRELYPTNLDASTPSQGRDCEDAVAAWATIAQHDFVSLRTIVIPIDIGSAAEPCQMADDAQDWSEANRWIMPPPSYPEALDVPPYVVTP